MTIGRITDAVKKGVLVSDGAWGTFLQQKGLKPGECPELWCVDRYGEVREIAEIYIKAGADMVGTNTFGANFFKLSHYGLEDRVFEINEAAARASREAAGEDIWVIASIGSTGKLLVTGEVTESELYDAFRIQATALEKGGADAVCIETMMDMGEAVQAIRATKENTKLEIICTFTFDRTARGEFRTMMGAFPEEAVLAAIDAGADIVGTNCSNGSSQMIEIVRQIKKPVGRVPVIVQSNAGIPVSSNGSIIYPETPEETGLAAAKLFETGANIVGGCCGTTPEHIRAIRIAADNFNRGIK